MFSCPPCEPVGRDGCALQSGLELRLNLLVLVIGVDRVEIIHPIKRRGGLSINYSLYRVYVWALSQGRLCPRVMIDARDF